MGKVVSTARTCAGVGAGLGTDTANAAVPPAGSEIAVSWHRDGPDELCVQVRDQGPGVPPDELESIFESFVQSSRTKDGSGGTGLGLAICRRIMAAHQGRISARNHPAGGVVFEFRLPALAAPGAASGQRWAVPSSLDKLPAHTLGGGFGSPKLGA